MYKIGDKVYELKMKAEYIENVEQQSPGTSLIQNMFANKGIMPMSVVRTLFVLGLIDSKTKTPVPQDKSLEVYEKLLNQIGFIQMNVDIFKQLEKDCPFLFHVSAK